MRNLFLIIVILFLSQAGYSQLPQGEINMHNIYYEIRNDSIFLSFELGIKTEFIHTCQSWVIVPRIAEKDNEVYFPYIQINGRNKKNMYNRWQKLQRRNDKNSFPYMLLDVNHKLDTTLIYFIQSPCEEWMEEPQLSLRQELIGCNDQRQVFIYNIDNFTLTLPEYEMSPLLSYIIPEIKTKVFHKKEQVILDYPLNGVEILPDFGDNKNELTRLKNIVSTIKDDKDIQINSIKIIGYASPEGAYRINEYLAKGRANSVRTYLSSNLGISQSMLIVDWVAEDWDGLENMVKLSDMLYKTEVLSIIRNIGIFEGREKKLMDLRGGQPYRLMQDKFFPYLRRVEYDIDYNVRDYNIEEVRNLIGKKNENLSQYELLLLATQYDAGSKEFNEVFDIIYTQFPNDYMARVNASAAMISRGELVKAQECLKDIYIPEAINNLGVIFLLLEEIEKAEELFNISAQQGCKEAKSNLKEIRLKKQYIYNRNSLNPSESISIDF